MVTSYDNSQCRYRLSNLDRVVYLLPESGDIHIDAGAAYVNYVPGWGEAYQLRVRSVSLTDTTEHSGRYNFKQALTFSLGGLVTDIPTAGRYYAIIKSNDGTYWIVNPYHPLTPTYVFTLDGSGPRTDYTLQDREAMPVLELEGFTPLHSHQCDVYAIDGVDRLFLNEVKYSAYRPNGDIRYTNNGFKEIVAMKNTVSLEQRYDGHNFYTTVRLSIPWDDFKTDWHYRLLEYKDNRYAAVLLSRAGNFYMAGFDDGLFPSYQVQADSIQGQTDRVDVTLVNARNHGPVQYAKAAEISQFTEKAFIPTSEHDGYICVSPGVAQYILKKEVDAFGNATGLYQAYQGYSERFSDLNLIETPFSEVITFPSAQCSPDGSQLRTTLTDVIYFHSRGSKEYTIYCNACSWTADTATGWLNIGPTTGAAKTNTVFTITNMLEPTESPASGQVTVECCEYTKVVTVIVVKGDDCFPPYTIDGAAQTLTANTNCCVAAVGQAPDGTEIVSIGSDNVVIKVDQNESGADRQFLIPVTYCDNTTGTITVNQSFNYSEWVEDGTICDDETKNLYVREVEYTGLTPTTINRLSGRVRQGRLLMEDSLECKEKQYKWVETDMMVCEAGLMYPLEVQLESVEGGPWVETGNQRTAGEPVDDPDGICEAKETIVDWLTIEGYICDGFAKYEKQQLRKSSDGGTTWTVEEVYRKGDKIADESTDCGYDPELYEHDCWEWFDFGNTRCDGFGLYHEEEFVWADEPCPADRTQWHRTDVKRFGYLINYPSETCGYDPVQTGSTWVDWVVVDNEWFCDNGVKYTLEEKFISEDAGATWDPTGITRKGGDVIEYESTDCGYIDGWCSSQLRDEKDYICDGVNKMHYLRRWVTFDCSVEHPVYEPTDMYVVSGVHTYNSTDCGYVPGGSDELDEWRSAEGTICDGTTKYSREEKYHSIDGGQYWVAMGVYRKGPEIERNSTDCGYDPNISDYAYEQWRDEQDYICEDVNKMHYVRKYVSDVSADGPWEATNIYRMSGVAEYNSTDCGYVPDSQDTGYTVQWVILPDQFICEGYSKYHKEMKQVSHDNGAHWVNTEVYRRGNLIEANSEYCGYRPTTEEKWENEGYMCEGYSKYNRQRKYTRPVGGTEWTATDQYRRGSFIEGNSEYCGYEPQTYTIWLEDGTGYTCNDTDKYHIQYAWTSSTGDEGSYVKTDTFRTGDLWERNSTDCGYTPPGPDDYDYSEWRKTEGYRCNGTTKYSEERRYVSNDNVNWIATDEYRTGSEVIEYDSLDCGAVQPDTEYRWILTDRTACFYDDSECEKQYRLVPNEYVCDGYNLVTKLEVWKKCPDDSDWVDTGSWTFGDTVIEHDSEECIGKVVFYYSNGDQYHIETPPMDTCDLSSDSTYNIPINPTAVTFNRSVLHINDRYLSDYRTNTVRNITLSPNLISIGGSVFSNCGMFKTITIPSSVVSIGEYAFNGCNSLSSITIPNSVTSLGEYAFYNCSGLISASIGSGISRLPENLFNGCYDLETVTVSDNLVGISNYVFSDCRSLTSFTMPNSVVDAGVFSTFRNCSSLRNVQLSNRLSMLGATMFYGCSSLSSITIPDSVTQIRESAFGDCISLTSVTIPSGVTSLGTRAFSGCTHLQWVRFEGTTPPSASYSIFDETNDCPIYVPCDSVGAYRSTFGSYAIRIVGDGDCGDLFTLTLSNGNTVSKACTEALFSGHIYSNDVKNYSGTAVSAVVGQCVNEIDDSTFRNFGNLSAVTIPNSVTYIGSSAFSNTALVSISLPNSVSGVGNATFSGCTSLSSASLPGLDYAIGSGLFYNCLSLASFTIPSGVVYIYEYAFANSGLRSITIPSNVLQLNASAFEGCPLLRTVTVEEGLRVVKGSAFKDCTGITSIALPSTLTELDLAALNGCTSLQSITLYSAPPKAYDGNGYDRADPFYNSGNCPIYVNNEYLFSYQTKWPSQSSRFVALS